MIERANEDVCECRKGYDMVKAYDATRGRDAEFSQMLDKNRSLFWDTDPDALDMADNRLFIISRLLSKGGMPGYLWVTKHYCEADIVEAIIRRRDMDPIMRNFMAERYHIPKEQLVKARSWR